MAKFLLPALTGEGGELAATSKGWSNHTFSDLRKLANALDAATKDLNPNVFVDAIPDIWGKVLVFANALANEGHPFHARAVASFRGMLAMLAMKVRRNYGLTVQEVDLAAADVPSKFARAVKHLLHEKTFAPGLTWNPIQLILLDAEVVGMCSPLTLVAPREGIDMPRAAARRLTDGFRFVDPTSNLPAQEAAELCDWLVNLNSHIGAAPNSDDDRRKRISAEIHAFAEALKLRAGQHVPGPSSLTQHPWHISHEAYRPLFQPLEIGSSRPQESDLFLHAREGAPKKLIVFDEKVAAQWSVAPTDVKVINGWTLAAFQGQVLGPEGNVLGQVPLPEGCEWIRPDHFLLPELTVIQMEKPFGSVERTRGETEVSTRNQLSALLPLKSEVSMYLDPEYVTLNCSFEQTNQGISFSFPLPVSDGKRTINFRCLYPFDKLKRIDPILLPVTEIWPPYKLEHWRYYYTLWSNDATSDRLYVRPCELDFDHTEESANGSKSVEVCHTKEAPRFLGCYESARSPTAEKLIGLLIPKYLVLPQNVMKSPATVGFDFGTTNTNIYLKRGESETPEPLTLSAGTVQIFRPDPSIRAGNMFRFFLPPGGPLERAPFLSLVRRRTTRTQGGEYDPVREAHVLFYDKAVQNEQLNDSSVRAYLKWDHDFNEDRHAFLKQLVLHTLLEAYCKGATSLSIYYSYPTAFTETTKEALDGFWLGIDTFLKNLPISCKVAGSQTESVATTYYFTQIPGEKKALAGVGTLVVDIGGGTSDISVWRRHKLEIQTSVRLSGREILLQPLSRLRTSLLPMLLDLLPNGGTDRPMFEKADGESFFRRLDALLRTSGDKLVDRLTAVLARPDFERLRSEIAIRMAGLFYFSGLLLREVDWLNTNDGKLPDIYVGGNGSKVLDWLAPPKYVVGSPITPLLIDALCAGAGADGMARRPQLVLSTEPKAEVACGLVYSSEATLDAPASSIKLISGENYRVGALSYKPTDLLGADSLAKGLEVGRPEELARLIGLYNSFAGRNGGILFAIGNTEEVIDRATDEINDWAHLCKGKREDEIAPEPLFVRGIVKGFPTIRWREKAADANA